VVADVANHGTNLLVFLPLAIVRNESNVACDTANSERSRYVAYLFRSIYTFSPRPVRNQADSLPDSFDIRIVFANIATNGSRNGKFGMLRER
jgi:hypothetical protein